MAERRFPCAQCGATLEFSPGAAALKCPHCGHENAVPETEAVVEEIDFRATLDSLEDRADTEQQMIVRCDACGAETHEHGNRTAMRCAFCGSNIVATAKSRTQIKPNAVLPFGLTRREAESVFDGWLGALWFAPGDLKRRVRHDGRLVGMYVPCWTFDCEATTDYTGQRGDAYYVSVPVTRMVGGKRVTSMTQQRRVRWSPRAGTVFNEFDDVLVIATDSLPEKHARELEPWDLQGLVPYADEYLSGFAAECYSVGLRDGFTRATRMMQGTIRGTVCAHIGGDEQRISSMKTAYDAVTFKHILLPVWLNAYRYHGRTYRFLVNARTGEVQGERPYSAWKIAGAVLLGIAVIAAIVLVVSLRG